MERVISVRTVGPYVLRVKFASGLCGKVDLSDELHGEVFEPLRDEALFAEARLDPELGTVAWPNGADLSPEFLVGRVLQRRRTAAAAYSRAR